MVIYFTRHSETIWNKKGILQGWKDSALTYKGKKSAERRAKILSKKDLGIQAIYTSDLGRCVQTAKIINKGIRARMFKSKQLRERNFGSLNGKPSKKIKKILNLADQKQKAPHGESFNDLKIRVKKFLKKLAKLKYKKVLLVVHEGTARAIFNSARRKTSDSAIYYLKNKTYGKI